MNIFNLPFVWNIFRLVLEKIFKLYETRFTLLKDVGVHENSRVLDIGCGNAEFSKYFTNLYVGVDSNLAFLESNRIKFSTKFFTDSLFSPQVQNTDFDLILLMDVVHHLDNDSLDSVLKILHGISSKKKVIFDPILEQDNIFGSILVKLDRGKFIRKSAQIIEILVAGKFIVEKTLYFQVGPTKCVMIVFN